LQLLAVKVKMWRSVIMNVMNNEQAAKAHAEVLHHRLIPGSCPTRQSNESLHLLLPAPSPQVVTISSAASAPYEAANAHAEESQRPPVNPCLCLSTFRAFLHLLLPSLTQQIYIVPAAVAACHSS
jgi:hypothetical protein